MAITSQEAIRFSDEKLRVAADLLARLDNFANTVINEWTAMGGADVIPNTTAVLRDGASPNDDVGTGGDGRHIVTGAKLNNIVNRLTELRSASASTGLAMGVAGVRNTVLQVAVNIVP